MCCSPRGRKESRRLSGWTELNPPGTCANPALDQQMARVLRKRDPAYLLSAFPARLPLLSAGSPFVCLVASKQGRP